MAIEVKPLAIPDVLCVTPKRFEDSRGFFSETYSSASLAAFGFDQPFVQDNHSLSAKAGTVRGLHYQAPPFAQAKLIRVIRGSIFDVAVDLRTGSQTFGCHVSQLLSSSNWSQLLVPEGFAHGFCTLEMNTEVIYKVTNAYAPQADGGVYWNDHDLAINWPSIAGSELSAKDELLPRFKTFQSPFVLTPK